MCLYIDKLKTEYELRTSSDVQTFWKLFIKHNDYLETPYQHSIIKKAGIFKIDKPITLEEAIKTIGVNERAFHARVEKDALKQDKFFAEYFSNNLVCVSVPIKVNKKDIIAYGIQDNVCFGAYEITQEDWDNIFKG